MNFTIGTQAQLDAAIAMGNLMANEITINDTAAAPSDKIVSLSWQGLQSVFGFLKITLTAPSATHLNNAFPDLVVANSVVIESCSFLTAISTSAFPSLVGNGVIINTNPELVSITGFQSMLSAFNGFILQSNPKLADISGFASLTAIGTVLGIDDNSTLQNVDPLCQVDFVRTEGMPGNTPVTITGNTSLDQYCGLANFAAANPDVNPGQWLIQGNLTNPTAADIAALPPCAAPTWTTLPPATVLLLCGDTRSIEDPIETGIPTADGSRSVTYNDVSETVGCSTIITRTWLALGFCDNQSEPFVQVITDNRNCPLTLVCPEDYHVTCSDTNLCPSTTGQASVGGAMPGAYELTYLDFVAKRSAQTCRPLIIKRRWTATSNCPLPNSTQQCVQTIYVPHGWPHFTVCGYNPGQFCGLG